MAGCKEPNDEGQENLLVGCLEVLQQAATKFRSWCSVNIVHLQRRPFPGSFSIERLFVNLRNGFEENDISIEQANAPKLSKGLWQRLSNVIWARQLSADVFHITGDIHYVACGLPKQKTILTIHDLEMLNRSIGLRRLLLKLFWFDIPLRFVCFVTVISEETKRQLIKWTGFDPERIHVIPNAVDPAFLPAPFPKVNDRPRVLHLGTKANKNLTRTIEAVKQLDVTLDVVGRLSELQLEQLEGSGLTYRNHVAIDDAELRQLYVDCHLVCFASTEEGFGLPILEAQAIGRPVVTSNCSSMPEVAGDAAVQIDPFDVDSIRQGVLTVLQFSEKERTALIEAGFNNVRKFRVEEIAGQYAELYRKVANS